ncbi:MAG: hypothetical protein ACOCUI_00445 [bacterium]
MKLIVDNNEKKYKLNGKNLSDVLDLIQNEFDKRIIEKIYINEVEVNKKYLTDDLIEVSDIEVLKIQTKTINELISETLDEIKIYLPKLKHGCIDAADLFRNNELQEANDKYQLILNGIEWYTKTISKILTLLEDDELKDQLDNELILMNTTLKELIDAHENEDIILVADILEYELTGFIDRFIDKNKIINK